MANLMAVHIARHRETRARQRSMGFVGFLGFVA
jgi:hypothetical protein